MVEHPLVWRGKDWQDSSWQSIASGVPKLDALLPNGGWPLGCTIEVLSEGIGRGELALFAHAIVNHMAQQSGWLAWLSPPALPYAPSWQALGVSSERHLLLTPEPQHWLWSAQQLLRSGCCSVLLAWHTQLTTQALRKLQLAIANQNTLFVLFRPMRYRQKSSLAPLRLVLSANADTLTIELIKRPRGWAGQTLTIARQVPYG